VLAFFVDKAYFAGGFSHDPVFDLIGIPSLPDRAGISLIYCFTIVRVDYREERLIGSTKFPGPQTEDPVYLVRPGQAIVQEIKFPAAEMGDLLGLL
jgi:hypothetical protein